MPILRLFALILLLVVPGISTAQGFEVAFGSLQQDTDQPVEVTADSLSLNQNDGTAVFKGNVLIIQGAMRMTAPEVRESVKNDDDRLAYGGALYNLGRQLEDLNLQRTGIELMLDSGKVTEADLPQYTFVAGQLAFNAQDYPKARERFNEAIALGYSKEEAEAFIARSFSLEGNSTEALASIEQQIDAQIAAGQVPNEELVKTGLFAAFEGQQLEEARKYNFLLLENYPSREAWTDAVSINYSLVRQDTSQVIDLLRFARSAGVMNETHYYDHYIEAADYRRLPAEVSAVTQEGISAGLLDSGDPYVSEVVRGANSFIDGLRADLGDLESDARASGANAALAISVGDTYLNFEDWDNAAELYELALTRPDVDRGLALTRLGIAQTKSGDHAAAQETFAKVQGSREAIARVWAAYAAEQASGGMTASAS